ncbi:MAG: hypothetical protein QOG77_1776 [Solirubrobacteraceae bacterium]|nr:hypothetical protein [Solirubrobacteraceae bacterium]
MAALPLPAAASGAVHDTASRVSEPTAEAAATALLTQKKGAKRKPPSRGGRVRLAWPRDRSEKAPAYPLARWLARQVGPDPDSREETRANAAATTPSTIDFVGGITTSKLRLIRSFDIPTTDASYARLANLSWTYDNALAAIAFLDADAKTQAEQLLDQLQALQRTDGSLDFAYDTSSGAGSAQIRSGALAWVGIAATYYRKTYGSTRYDPLIAGIAKYLLGLRTSAGLVKGGPDVSWVSTQHNLLTVSFLRDLVPSLQSRAAASSLSLSATTLNSAQSTMGNAIVSNLLVQSGSTAYFIEGVGDSRIPVDVQSFGLLYLKLRNDARYAQVATYLQSAFNVAPRTSTALGATVSGVKPFNAAASPDIVWSEGTIQAKVALWRTGLSTPFIETALVNLAGLTNSFTDAPPAADRNINTDTSWGEWHTWPASASASWMVMLLVGEGRQLFTR